jgi:hypothetical protein
VPSSTTAVAASWSISASVNRKSVIASSTRAVPATTP